MIKDNPFFKSLEFMCLFVSHLRYICLIQGYLVSPKSPIASVLKFRYKVQFELIFVCDVRKGLSLIFSYLDIPLSQKKNCWKVFLTPSPLNCLATSSRNQVIMHMWFYFWTLFSFYWFIHLSSHECHAILIYITL